MTMISSFVKLVDPQTVEIGVFAGTSSLGEKLKFLVANEIIDHRNSLARLGELGCVNDTIYNLITGLHNLTHCIFT